MKSSQTTALMASLVALSFLALAANAAEEVSTATPKQVTQPASDGEITASPTISKTEVKRLERIKEKSTHSRHSFTQRCFDLTQTTLSY